MNYLIHACPDRADYVKEFLIPEMISQGIDERDIDIYMDENREGNLKSFINSIASIVWPAPWKADTWHLQDDVAISDEFRNVTESIGNFGGIACGFCFQHEAAKNTGIVPLSRRWWSFQCIRIPNWMADEFIGWFTRYETQKRFMKEILAGKYDDLLFWEYVQEMHPETEVMNIAPNIVEHVDFIIGGSVANKDRKNERTSSALWEEGHVTYKVRKWAKERERDEYK